MEWNCDLRRRFLRKNNNTPELIYVFQSIGGDLMPNLVARAVTALCQWKEIFTKCGGINDLGFELSIYGFRIGNIIGYAHIGHSFSLSRRKRGIDDGFRFVTHPTQNTAPPAKPLRRYIVNRCCDGSSRSKPSLSRSNRRKMKFDYRFNPSNSKSI